MLATLEDILFFISDPALFQTDKILPNLEHLRKFFEEFRNVKVLRLHHGLGKEVANLLRQPTASSLQVYPYATTLSGSSGTPVNSNKSQFTMDIFPALEEIVVYKRTPWGTSMPIGEQERASFSSCLGLWPPFVTARHELGRPVKVFWNTDEEDPGYFMADSA